MGVERSVQSFVQRYGRVLMGLAVLALLVHDVFGKHGYLELRRTKQEISKVQLDLDRLNKENTDLAEEVKALQTDPKKIEQLARDEMGLAKEGEVIIRMPQEPEQKAKP